MTPAIEPGYLSHLIPASPPHDPEPWEDIMKDVEDKIMVGMTHWQHPRFHAYFPAGNSFPSILADMLSGAIGCVGFSWVDTRLCLLVFILDLGNDNDLFFVFFIRKGMFGQLFLFNNSLTTWFE